MGRTVAKLMSEATADVVSTAAGNAAKLEANASRREPGAGTAPAAATPVALPKDPSSALDAILGRVVPGFASAG
jgi:hypothetical protein